MADYTNQAKRIYEQFCAMLEKKEWKYTRHDDDLTITCGARGDDLPMDLVVIVNPKNAVLSIFSVLPFKIKEDKRVEAALAISMANYGIVRGSFDYDLSDGEIRFRLAYDFADCIVSDEALYTMLMVTCTTVDKYNDKFLCISNGIMDFEAFAKWEQGKE